MTTMTEPVTAPPRPVPAAAPRVPAMPARVPDTAAKRTAATLKLLTVVALAGGTVLAGIGFTGSYSALTRLGYAHGFGWFAHVFPIGLDAGIVVLLALDLLLVRRDTPWPMLRRIAHLFTAATIYFNASSTGHPLIADPTGAAMHAVIPLMFVMSVDAGRRLIIRMTDLEAGREAAGVPLHRWILAPYPSWRMYRRMRLRGIPSYAQAVALERDHKVYRVMLDRRYEDAGKAPSDARLPLTMEKYGLSVDEALALPQQAEEAERLRVEREQIRAEEAEIRAMQRAADREEARLLMQAGIEAARHQAAARSGVAAAQTRGVLAEADAAADAQTLAAQALTEAQELADTAEARRRQADAEKAAAEARKAASVIDEAASVTEKAAAETRLQAAETNRLAAEKERAAEAAQADAEHARKDAAETRQATAVIELRAVEAEDKAKLSPRERSIRRVARLILAAGGSAEAVDLKEIGTEMGVSPTTASEYRREATDLIANGYRP